MWIGRKGVDKMRLPRKDAEKKQRVRDGPRDLQPRSFKHIVVTQQSWGSGEGTEALQRKPWKPVAIQISFLSNHPWDKARTVTLLTETGLTTNRKLSPSVKLLVSLRQKLAHGKDPEDKLDNYGSMGVSDRLCFIFRMSKMSVHTWGLKVFEQLSNKHNDRQFLNRSFWLPFSHVSKIINTRIIL